jgi:acyl carrier protein
MQDRIRDVLAAHGGMEVDPRDVDDQADLYELGLTSFASVNVMLGLEDAFDIEFPDEVLKKGTFASVRNIEQVIEGLVKSSADAAYGSSQPVGAGPADLCQPRRMPIAVQSCGRADLAGDTLVP